VYFYVMYIFFKSHIARYFYKLIRLYFCIHYYF